MKHVHASLVAALVLGSWMTAAAADDSVDTQIAAAERENALLKKKIRLQQLETENADLRARLRPDSREPAARSAPMVRADAPSGRPTDAYAMARPTQYAKAPYEGPPTVYERRDPWTGAYLGAHIGLGYASGLFSETGQSVSGGGFNSRYLASNSFDALGVTVGAHAGYMWRVGHFVFGPEVDLDVTSIASNKPTGIGGLSFCPAPCVTTSVNFTGDYHLNVHWLTSARLRAGASVGDWLIFGTAGVAAAAFEFRPAIGGASNTDVAFGYATRPGDRVRSVGGEVWRQGSSEPVSAALRKCRRWVLA